MVQVSLSEIKIKDKDLFLMNVIISSQPSLKDVLGLMDKINKIADEIKGDYISVTDLSNLSTNSFLGSLIIYGMEHTYKSFLAVRHKALISFVLLGNDLKSNQKIVNSLKTIDNTDKDKYTYRYFFIKDINQVKTIAESLL